MFADSLPPEILGAHLVKSSKEEALGSVSSFLS